MTIFFNKTQIPQKYLRYSKALSLIALLSLSTCIKTPSIHIKKSETFYNNLSGTPENLHPIKSTDAYASIIHSYTLEALLTKNLDTYEWEPSIARKWTINPDGKTFTFYLHKNLKWSDGKNLTAKDVKFTFDASKNPKYGGLHLLPYLEGLKSAEIIDDHTIRFKAKNIYFGNFDVIGSLTIIPEHIYKDPKLKMPKTVIGSGPYVIEHNIKGKIIVLRKNPFWKGAGISSNKGKWNFNTIVLRFIKTSNDSLLRLQRGDIDYSHMTSEDYIQKTNKDPWGITLAKVKAKIKKPKGYSYIGFNFKKPLFQDKKLRRALAHLMNRKLMNEKFFYKYKDLATGPWSLHSAYADPKVKPIDFNPQKAQQILTEQGWKDNNRDGILEKSIQGKTTDLSFTLLYANPDSEKFLTIYQEDLKQAGIKLNLQILDWTSLLRLLDDQNFDTVMLGWGGGSIDIDPKQIWHSDSAIRGGSNFISYSNPKVDKLIEKGRGQLNKKERIKTFQQVYRLIAEDTPYLFMFTSSYTFYGVNKRILRPKDTFNYDTGEDYWKLKTK